MAGKRSIPFEGTLHEVLADPEAAIVYLQECLADGNMELFKAALKDVADARLGGMTALAEKLHMSRTSLYKTLSENGNPKFDTINKVLDALGMRVSVEAVH